MLGVQLKPIIENGDLEALSFKKKEDFDKFFKNIFKVDDYNKMIKL